MGRVWMWSMAMLCVVMLGGCAGVSGPTRGGVGTGVATIDDASWRAGLAEALRADVEVMANEYPGRHASRRARLEGCASFLERSLRAMGLSVESEWYQAPLDPFAAGGKVVRVRNIVAEIPGRVEPEKIVLVGAHYDTEAQTPGADDNASGVAVVLALAEWFSVHRPDATVRFVLFVNEEAPYMWTEWMGSFVHARASQSRGDRIAGAICLDMVGYFTDEALDDRLAVMAAQGGLDLPDRGDFIAIAAWDVSAEMVGVVGAAWEESGAAVRGVRAVVDEGVGDVARSDQWSFWQVGYPAVLITDTGEFRNPHYHAASDRAETLDYEKMAEVAVGLRAAVEAVGAMEAREVVMQKEVIEVRNASGEEIVVVVEELGGGERAVVIAPGARERIELARAEGLMVEGTRLRWGVEFEVERVSGGVLWAGVTKRDGSQSKTGLGVGGRATVERDARVVLNDRVEVRLVE